MREIKICINYRSCKRKSMYKPNKKYIFDFTVRLRSCIRGQSPHPQPLGPKNASLVHNFRNLQDFRELKMHINSSRHSSDLFVKFDQIHSHNTRSVARASA